MPYVHSPFSQHFTVASKICEGGEENYLTCKINLTEGNKSAFQLSGKHISHTEGK